MGAPVGNQNGAKGRKWSGVIAERLAERQKMAALADVLIDKALDGDIAAIKEIGDRVDGKAKQQTELTGADDQPLLRAIEIKLARADDR